MRGYLVDAILDARGKEVASEYYDQIAETGSQGFINLRGAKNQNLLHIDKHQIILTKQCYPEEHVELLATLEEFKSILTVVHRSAKITGFRRIGLAAEHRFKSGDTNNNKALFERLTTLPTPKFGASFALHYESRKPTSEGISPDINKSDFTNTIVDFYDSANDASFPADGQINANLDYQRYYTPPFDGKLNSEVEKQFYAFKKELELFHAELTRLGFHK